MSYSIGGQNLSPVEDRSASYLGALNDATQNMNNSLKDLAKLPGDYLNYMQDNADARYVAALNKYSNDPTGLAKALQNGEIDTSNVRAETLGKTQDTLSNIQKTYGLNYLQGRTEADMNFMDKNGDKYMLAKKFADSGDLKGLANVLGGLENAPWESTYKFSQLSAQPEYDAMQNRGLQARGLALQERSYADNIAANGAAFNLIQLAQKYADADPNERQEITNGIFSGKFIDGSGNVINTMPWWQALQRSPAMLKAVLDYFGVPSISKVSAIGSEKDGEIKSPVRPNK